MSPLAYGHPVFTRGGGSLALSKDRGYQVSDIPFLLRF